MQKSIGGSKYVFKDKLNFDDYLTLTNIQQQYSESKIDYKGLIYGSIKLVLISLDEQEDSNINIEKIKHIDDIEVIEELANIVGNHVLSLQETVGKKKKS